jgi:hypothetical protein
MKPFYSHAYETPYFYRAVKRYRMAGTVSIIDTNLPQYQPLFPEVVDRAMEEGQVLIIC